MEIRPQTGAWKMQTSEARFLDKKPVNFLLVGVGGQGTILASNVVAEVGLRLGYEIKQAEVHGMSQRGGSVTSHLRWSGQVFSPIIPRGEADFVIAFEKLEAGRFAEHIRPNGTILVNDYSIIPVTVSSGGVEYPDDARLRKLIAAYTKNSCWIKGLEIAEEIGNTKTANVVMLGALCALMKSDPTIWLDVISNRVPQKLLQINQKAFQAGFQTIQA